jgi:hypothetical protein
VTPDERALVICGRSFDRIAYFIVLRIAPVLSPRMKARRFPGLLFFGAASA